MPKFLIACLYNLWQLIDSERFSEPVKINPMKKFEFKYQFEFFCSPIWIEENVKNPTPRNVEIADLDINPYLKEELEELNHLYQEIFNDNYPPESDFKDAVSKYIFEPTLKSKACLKCLYFTIIIFDLCRYLEYFSYLCTINQTE